MTQKIISLGGKIDAPSVAHGCFRVAGMTDRAVADLLSAAIDCGVNFFDHADIYGGGECENVFGRAVKLAGIRRDDIIVQTKCGIGSGQYNFERDYIIKAAEGSLKRLGTDRIDIYLLHRPDALFEPEEVAEAFDALHAAGKVKYFGVSNHNPSQINLLHKYLKDRLIVNQLQFSLVHTGLVDSGLNVNMKNAQSVDHDGGLLDYCRLENITVQAWSPLLYGHMEGVFLDNPAFPELNEKINELAEEKGVSASAIAIAWILRHPAKIQAIAGTTKPERFKQMAKASGVELSRSQWYALYLAAGNKLP
ncbi:MAG: aldo/keto reductase [Defluviitaleaceae bacterium]|nr:aldo/keto reductase [Defluviitaleaceae bacterium]